MRRVSSPAVLPTGARGEDEVGRAATWLPGRKGGGPQSATIIGGGRFAGRMVWRPLPVGLIPTTSTHHATA